jgi:predicted acetyltransferase
MLQRTKIDRFTDGDVLVLSDDTGDVATATSLSLKVNVRGTALPCQGVAWVGTVRSHRRRKVDGRGLASRVMDLLREKAIERKQVVSMLAPFRVSFYEHFGYGVSESQHVWTVPLKLLPEDDTGGFGEYREADFAAALANRQRQFKQTHGDVATDERGLRHWLDALGPTNFRFVDRQNGNITSQFSLATEFENDLAIATVNKPFWDSPAAFRRMLAMLGTLRDQYSQAKIALPADLPLNWWLSERQIPHRRVDHPAARCSRITRMQSAIVDVPRFIDALTAPPTMAGVIRIKIDAATYRLEIADSHTATLETTEPADFETDAPTFAAIGFGELPPEQAVLAGRLKVNLPQAMPLLAALVGGRAPYCHEYF